MHNIQIRTIFILKKSKFMEENDEIDVIIISYAQTEELKAVTLNCINSLVASEDPAKIKFNILVIESEKSIIPYQYPYSKTIYPDVSFSYNKYLNIGIKMTSARYVCACNNDLIFHPNWATELLKPMKQFVDLYSASPICPVHHKKMGYKLDEGIVRGYRIRFEVSGWCILMKRSMFKITGMLDSNYLFWFSDNDYVNTLFALKLYHVLVTTSVVEHLESKTLNEQTKEREDELTDKEITYYKKKWDVRLGTGWSLA